MLNVYKFGLWLSEWHVSASEKLIPAITRTHYLARQARSI